MTVIFNGWAAGPDIWNACRFKWDRLFSYLDQLDGEPARFFSEISGSVIVVGFSMGATSALQLALRFPEKIRALVLVSATARMMEDPQTGWKGMSIRRRAALKLGTQITYRDNTSALFAEANLDRGLDFLQTTDIREDLRRLDSDSPLRRIPVVLFQSERDGIVRPSNVDFLKSVFPQAEVVRIPGTEHTLPPHIPGEIDRAVNSVNKFGL